MFLAGCLLSWLLIGTDPIRRRPGTPGRLAVLVIAACGHDTLAKLMFAWNLPADAGPVAARHFGSELMYYGGTVIDVALAVIMMAQWYAATGRTLARERRRAAPAVVRAAITKGPGRPVTPRPPRSSRPGLVPSLTAVMVAHWCREEFSGPDEVAGHCGKFHVQGL
jgi:hypothetical protein